MSYYEFIFNGVLTTDYDEKTKLLLKEINENYVPFVIHKYIDEVISEDKKNRTLYIHSHINMSDYLFNKFANSGLEMRVYFKQQLI